jgi:hypothetical protein
MESPLTHPRRTGEFVKRSGIVVTAPVTVKKIAWPGMTVLVVFAGETVA